MRMAGDAERTLPPNLAQDGLGGLIGADELLDVKRNDVRVLPTAQTVLRHLDAGDNEHPVLLHGALGFLPDVCEVRLKVLFAKSEAPLAERRNPGRARKQVLFHQDVIGNGDDIELAGRAVQIDDFANRQLAITPLRVNVEVAEQKWFVPRHQVLTSTD